MFLNCLVLVFLCTYIHRLIGSDGAGYIFSLQFLLLNLNNVFQCILISIS